MRRNNIDMRRHNIVLNIDLLMLFLGEKRGGILSIK